MQLVNWMGYGTKNQNVLALSGGGVRGIASLMILVEIEERIGKKAGDIFSLIAATSVGCLIASLLNLPSSENPLVRKYSAKDLTGMMEDKMKIIFHRSFLNKLESADSAFAPKYTEDGMVAVLNELFQDTLAKDLLGHYTFSSFDTTNFKNGYFPYTDKQAKEELAFQELKVKDMIQGVTAASTYFPSKKIGVHNIIDGGILENNPSVRAYAEAKDVLNCGENMTLLSIGTGIVDFHLPDTNWGSLHWATWILPSMFTGQDSAIRSLADKLLNLPSQPKKYFAVQFDIEEGKDALDDTSDENIAYLKNVAKIWINSVEGKALLDEVCKQLI